MSTRSQQLPSRIVIVLGLALIVMAGVLFIAHRGQSATATAPPASGAGTTAGAVQIKDFLFAPAATSVTVGTKITFTNRDKAPHTATSDDGVFDTGTLGTGQSKRVTLDKAGTFAYHCTIHPFMKATVTVT